MPEMITKTLLFTTLIAAVATAVYGTGAHRKVGGHEPFDMKDVPPAAIDAAFEKFESYRENLENADNSMFKLTKPVVAQVETQVVSGVMYYFTVLAGQSTCRKGRADTSTCSMEATPLRRASIECVIKVWSQPWNNGFMEAQKVNINEDCKPSKLQIPAN